MSHGVFMFIKMSLYSIVVFFLVSCAISPLGLHETGRSVGQAKNEFIAGFGQAGYVFKWINGVTDNLDFGVQLETLSLGARLKYSIINQQKDGFSFATAAGFGVNLGGRHYYGDLIGSYLINDYEPYLGVRVTRVRVNFGNINNSNGVISENYHANEFSYGQIFLGFKYQLSEKINLTLEASTLSTFSSDLKVDQVVLGSLGFGYRF